MPYHGSSAYSYLKGEVYFELFGNDTASETRLVIDAPEKEEDEYPRDMYIRQDYQDAMYYHNNVTRLQHLAATNRIRISYDQNTAHHIFSVWKDRALSDASISGISHQDQRREWVTARITVLDYLAGRALGLRVSEELKGFLAGRNEDPGEGASADIDMLDMVLDMKQLRQAWKKNKTQGRKRNKN